jgi:hypothetical protein
LALPALPASAHPRWQDPEPPGEAQPQTTYSLYVPLVAKPPCQATGESYGSLAINGSPADRPAEFHADLNLALRSYALNPGVYLGLVDYGGDTDSKAPQLNSLFSPARLPAFVNAYRVYNWNWAPPPDPGTRGTIVTDWPATLIGMAVTPGELIRAPNSGYDIGGGFEVMVLYAAANRITLKYTREDNVVYGYTIHVENVCVDQNLLALYQLRNSQGRGNLPALQSGEAFGRADGSEVIVAIRDTGAFMDPRTRKDWWQAY